MRHNPHHAVTDPAIVRRMIRENPWATFVSHHDGLTASHYPILLDEEMRAGRVKKGQLAMVLALGTGVHWGCALWRL